MTAEVSPNRRAILAAGIAAAALPLLRSRPSLAQATATAPKRIVFVISNPAVMAPDNAPLGFWLPELAHPAWPSRSLDGR